MAEARELTAVGQRAPRVDGVALVTGSAVYAADVQIPGALHARFLHSPHAHARIRRLDVRQARALPGVVAVLTAAETDDLDLFPREEVCFQGQKVAMVAALDPDVAEDALALIKVRYEVLPAVLDPVAGMAPDAPEARLGAPTKECRDADGRLLRNVVGSHQTVEGDVARAFAEADVVVESEYRIPYHHQTYLEPSCATARPEAGGRVTVWASTQGTFALRDQVAGALRLPHARVRVVGTQVGGAFGARNEVAVAPYAALMALRTGRPVKAILKRDEEFLDTCPAPGCVARLKVGARRDGTLTAMEGRIVWDAGWAGGGGGAGRLRGLYKIPHVRLEGFGVRTNKPSPGAYRAPGAPQSAFIRESTVDQVARALGIDPVELRLRNALGPGDLSLGAKPLEQDWLRTTIRRTALAAGWGQRKLGPNQGMGIACGEWTNWFGPTNATVTVAEDGSVSLLTGQVDITGLHTSLAQVVAEELRVPVSRVRVILGDTDSVPYTVVSGGSLATCTAGTAVREAARQARERILRAGAEFLQTQEEVELADQKVRVKGEPERAVALAALAASVLWKPEGPLCGHCVLGSIPSHPSYSVHVATVEVDPQTGQVRLLDLVAGQDVGRALNPMLVEGQMQGGAVQSLGLGLMEGYKYGADDRMLNPNLVDYAIPTAADLPAIHTVIVEEPCSTGPYGAKGVGEPPIIPTAAAVANAVQAATGARVTELPMTPERVLAALHRQGHPA
ncbi:MAG: xanthine dehydrogenase family protein molybdopterin-binding subunit [Candidatus Latescibacterota bacterium]